MTQLDYSTSGSHQPPLLSGYSAAADDVNVWLFVIWTSEVLICTYVSVIPSSLQPHYRIGVSLQPIAS